MSYMRKAMVLIIYHLMKFSLIIFIGNSICLPHQCQLLLKSNKILFLLFTEPKYEATRLKKAFETFLSLMTVILFACACTDKKIHMAWRICDGKNRRLNSYKVNNTTI